MRTKYSTTHKNMFNFEWEINFFFIQNYEMQAQCLACLRKITRMSKYDLKRHYDTYHKNLYSIVGEARKTMLADYKNKFYMHEYAYPIANKECQREKASFVVALALAKHGRPFADGEFFKTLCNNVLECFAEGKEMQEILETIPLSRQTIARRTEIISSYIHSCTKERLATCKYFSLCLDESTDSNNICQLIVCVKTVNEELETFEEIFATVAFHSNVKGETLYKALNEHVFAIADTAKLTAICTDGANVMIGSNIGLVGQLHKNNIRIPTFHCVIHQQVLFSKELKCLEAMEKAIKIINRIKGGHNALKHRQFKTFLEETDAEHNDLLLYTEVRWLSRGKSLQRLFDLREEVKIFLDDSSDIAKSLVLALNSGEFLMDLAFLCDITKILNKLNLTLQGHKLIIDLYKTITQFEQRLLIFIEQINNNNLVNMPNLAAIVQEYSEQNRLEYYRQIVSRILENYKTRFQDLAQIKPIINLHDNPLTCDISTFDSVLQSEINEMRADCSLPFDSGCDFWRQIEEEKYPLSKNEVLKLYSMFGSTYSCEAAFSTLKYIQNKYRNRLSNNHISDLIRIKQYNKEINIDNLIQLNI